MVLLHKERANFDWTDDSIRLIVSPSQEAKSTYFYVQEVGRFQTGPNYFTERELLSSFLVVFTLSGKGYLTYQNKTFTLLPYQGFFIDCMEKHYYKSDEKDLWEISWLHFNGEMGRAYYQQFKRRGTPIIQFKKRSQVPELIDQLIIINQRKDFRTEPLSCKLIVDILTEILIDTNDRSLTNFMIPEDIQKAIKYIEEHYKQTITLDVLSKITAKSKFYLSRQFKEYTGFTPNEYVINQRISHAKRLLRYSNLSVTEIAAEIGVENVSHFINLFKKREGITPFAFKKRWKTTKKE